MSKKQLLSEGEIRRFMKYANLGPLSENFLSEMDYGKEMEEAMYEEEDMGDMGDEPMGDEPAPAPESDVTVDDGRLMDMITQAVEAALAKAGVGGGSEEGGEDMDVDMGDEEEMEGGEEEELEEMYHSYKEGMYPMDEEGMYPMDEERMVSEVARRVMARLSESRKPAPARRSRAAAINEVTDRIMNRILKGK